jgi:hypothetical protein
MADSPDRAEFLTRITGELGSLLWQVELHFGENALACAHARPRSR